MPRRRKTTASSAKRPRAKMPDGDEGKNLSDEQKQEKLEVLLSDFDAQVTSRINEMESEAAKHLHQIETLTRMEKLKTPKHILELEVDDLIEWTEDLDALVVVKPLNNQAMQAYASSLDAKCNATVSQKPLDTISEESDDDPGTVKKGKGGRPIRRKKGTLKVNHSINLPPPSTTRPRRTTRQQQQLDQLQTPGFAGAPSASGWETPLVTPRFDPRLPKTPAVLRNPKPGERTMTISLAGSPLANRIPQQGVADTGYMATVPLHNNKTLVVNEDTDLETFRPSDLGEDVMQKLRQLHQKLGNVLQMDTSKQQPVQDLLGK